MVVKEKVVLPKEVAEAIETLLLRRLSGYKKKINDCKKTIERWKVVDNECR